MIMIIMIIQPLQSICTLCKLGYFLCIRCGLEYIFIFQSEGFDSEFEARSCTVFAGLSL